MNLEKIRGLVAQGWCTEENKHLVMDPDLAEAISQIIFKSLEEERRKAMGFLE